MSDTELLEWENLTFYERVALKERSERSFLNFTRIWFELIQGDKLLVNWHHRLMAKKIDEVLRGTNNSKNLAIALPPGGTKTEFMSIHLPAYTNMLVNIGVLNRFRNLNLSFADTLVKRNSRRTRDIIASKEYQELWPCQFGVNQAEEWQIVDAKGKVKGETVSRAMGGQITGGRGGYPGEGFSGSVNLDDPDKPEDMFSQVKRDASQRKLVNTVRSRRGDKSKDHPTPFFVIQQRLHVEDTIGFCMSGGMGVKFELVQIPALITKDFLDTLDEDTRNDCWNSIKDSDSRVINGVEYWSYWPEMEHIDQLIDLWERDEYTFLSQYMQAPKMLSGGLIETDWFQTYTQLPFLEYASIYVDTNSGKVKDHNDYTVFTLCGMGVDGNMYVLDSCRGKWDPTDLLETAESLWKRWTDTPYSQRLTVRYMSIEDKQAGQGLITTLQKRNSIPVHSVQRGQDQNKLIRHNNCQPQMKMGKVFIPALHDEDGNKIFNTTYESGEVAHSTEWVQPFLAELAGITVGVLTDKEKGFDDQYDTLMDAIDDMLIHNHSAGLASWIG
ncbi:phage terminase large subunit [Pseudoalteromonas sp.]|uniref:phage terminase large subunit n=1 Tax=Pseudoalteromonas sp. TaxID=53249 RepID=UPI003561EEB3